MKGATDVQLRVTMDSSQARAEVQNLHREMQRRWRKPTADDAWRLMWDRASGMPANPMNPALPYEQARHSGIWWANQAGIRGLGSQQYRHQFFTEREARYMGMQFAKAARKELVAGAKSFAVSMGLVGLDNLMMSHFAWANMPGENNRRVRRDEATWSAAKTGAMEGIGISAPLAVSMAAKTKGASLLAVPLAAGAGAVMNAWGASDRAKAGERNQDISWRREQETQDNMRMWNRRLAMSEMALNRQMELMPSRDARLDAVRKQMRQIDSGEGSFSIKNLQGLYNAMLEGGTWKGKKYNAGDLESQKGQWVTAMLARQKDRMNALMLQQYQLSMRPYATPKEAITDSYSRRWLYVGAQVDTISFNRSVLDSMKRIVAALEAMRKGSGENTRVATFENRRIQYR